MTKQLQSGKPAGASTEETLFARGERNSDRGTGTPLQIEPLVKGPDKVDELRQALISALCMAV